MSCIENRCIFKLNSFWATKHEFECNGREQFCVYNPNNWGEPDTWKGDNWDKTYKCPFMSDRNEDSSGGRCNCFNAKYEAFNIAVSEMQQVHMRLIEGDPDFKQKMRDAMMTTSASFIMENGELKPIK